MASDAAKVTGIIVNDFKRCVYIKPVDGPQPAVDPAAPALESFKAAGAQFVLTGRVDRAGGRFNTDFRLFDTASGQQVAGQHYTTDLSNGRRVAHIVADAVFTRITGEKGFFDSRVVFVDEIRLRREAPQAPGPSSTRTAATSITSPTATTSW